MTDVADADSEEETEGREGTKEAQPDPDAEPDADGVDGNADTEDADDTDDENAVDEEVQYEDTTDELISRVAAVDEAVAVEVEAIQGRVHELESELAEREATLAEREETVEAREGTIEELESKLKRAHADFQNYKKRAKGREEELRERATEDLVERLLDVRDNLVRAVEQDDDVEVRDGVEATLATFDRVLDSENVAAIEPDAGEDVEPDRHEVVHRTESDLPEGAIAEVYRPGYEMAGKVLRPAQVTVSEGGTEEPDRPDSEQLDEG